VSTRTDGEPEAKRAAFDALAPRWDDLKPEEAVVAGFDRGLALLGDLSGLQVVDLGCGTGRLEAHLLPRLGPGRVVGVDFSPGMIARASLGCPSPQVTWLCRDVVDTGLATSSADLVLCFNSFPHFPDGEALLREAVRWLRPGGRLLLWHDLGRERLAEVHRKAGPPVHEDLLPPVDELAQLAGSAGFEVGIAEEDDSSYTLLARRPH
jgi:demethylmenaquinone methyltransferase/2-methoxy-6-polyprenyl-1,4-benzoquinol methylase